MILTLLLVFGASLGASCHPEASGLADASLPPSVLFVSMDDVGTDQLTSYEPNALPCTPTLDALAASGVRFTRAYAQPVCSSTRASWITGRMAHRTGTMTAITRQIPRTAAGLSLSEYGIAEHLRSFGWDTWAVGKWHLNGDRQVDAHPNALGFTHYRGDLGGAPGLRTGFANYFDWDRTVDGLTTRDLRYITTVMTEDALALMDGAAQPWFGYVSFNDAHTPWHDPPYCGPADCLCGNGAVDDDAYPNLVESLDAHLKVIIDEAMRQTNGNLIILVVGDNGTPRDIPANKPCPREGKGLMYEGGVNVPLLLYMPGQDPDVCDDLVAPMDLYAIFCDLLGVPIPPEAEDAMSLGTRTHMLLEFNFINGLPWVKSGYRRTLIEHDWKLIRRDPDAVTAEFPAEQLFHLASDPCEMVDLYPPMTSAEVQAYSRLTDELEILGGE